MADEPDTKKRRLPTTVVLLGLTSFFTDAGSEMIFPLLPVFLASLGASPTYLGLIEGSADTVSSLLKLASGRLADRLGRKKPLVLFGYALASAVRPLVAIATAPWHVLAVRITDRVGKGVRSSPRDALIADSAHDGNAGRAFGFHRAMDHAGAVAGPLIALALAEAGFATRAIFWVAVIPGAVATSVLFFVREKSIAGKASPVPTRQPSLVGGTPLPARLKGYLAILLLFSLGNSSDAFLLYRASHDFDLSAPLLWTVFHVAKLTSSYVAGGLSDRVPRTRLILIGWAIYAATYAGFAFADRAWELWALFLVYGLYYGLSEPAEKALVRDLAPEEARGKAFGAYNFVVGIAALPAGLLTGALWGFGPPVALGVSAALAGVAAVLLAVWRRPRL